MIFNMKVKHVEYTPLYKKHCTISTQWQFSIHNRYSIGIGKADGKYKCISLYNLFISRVYVRFGKACVSLELGT